MPIPALDHKGLLPPGVHDCHWPEVVHEFCWNPQRVELYEKLQDFLQQVWDPLGLRLPIWIDGSFTRKKETPKDIDLVIEADRLTDIELAPVLKIFFQRDIYQEKFSVDFWFRHAIFPHDLSAFFQYTGTKAGAELQLNPKHVKGILRVLP